VGTDTDVSGTEAGWRKPEAGHREYSAQVALAALGLGPVVVLLAVVGVMSLVSPFFFTERNLTNLLTQTSSIAVLGMGALIVLLARGLDISVGSMIGLSGVVGALLFTDEKASWLTVVVAMLAVTAGIGFVNGFIYVVGKLPHPLIVTLGMLSIARGAAYVVGGGFPIPGAPDFVVTLGSGDVGPLPVAALVMLGAAAVTTVILRYTRWGRWVYAIGGNPEAARRTGIPVNQVIISTYAVGGLFAGVSALIVYGRTATGDPNAGFLAELDAIAAVVIGGAGFLGGRGHVGHVLVGALTIAVIRNGMNLLDVSPYYQLMVLGVVVIIAVVLDVQRSRLVRRLQVIRARQAGLVT
jgi:ribose transport system permease protein